MKLSELLYQLTGLLARGEDGFVWCDSNGVYMQSEADAEVKWIKVERTLAEKR